MSLTIREPVRASTILGSFRDLGGRLPAGPNRLSCEPNFNRYASFWLAGETLDATYAAIELLELVRSARHVRERRGEENSGEVAEPFIARHSSRINRFLADHYDRDSGIFWTDGRARTAGIFACHTAIGVMKGLHWIRCEQPLRREAYVDTVKRLGAPENGEDPVEALLSFLRLCSAASPEPGTFVDHPESLLPPSVTVLYTASSILRNIFSSDHDSAVHFLDLVDRRDLESFLARCLKRYQIGSTEVAGFTIHPDIEEPCVNTTYFALNLLRRFDLLDVLVDEPEIAAIVRFLEIHYQGGGFRSTLREVPSLNATFFGLKGCSLLTDLSTAPFLRHAGNSAAATSEFVDSCTNGANGGAAFAADLTRYVENCLATRYAVQILEMVGQRPARVLDRASAFCRRQFRTETGGFRGYPADRVSLEKFSSVERLEHYLAQKDKDLATKFETTTFRSAELMIDRLYDQLGELYAEQARGKSRAELGPKTESVFADLRRLQSQQAARLRELSVSRLRRPLDHGQKLIESARAEIAKHEDPAAGH